MLGGVVSPIDLKYEDLKSLTKQIAQSSKFKEISTYNCLVIAGEGQASLRSPFRPATQISEVRA